MFTKHAQTWAQHSKIKKKNQTKTKQVIVVKQIYLLIAVQTDKGRMDTWWFIV